MKSLIYLLFTVIVLALGFAVFKAEAAPTSWDYASGVLQPLQSAWGAQVKGSYFTATSTTASTFPYASTTAISASSLSSGNCVQASTGGLLTTTGVPCGSGSGTVTQINTTFPILGGPITTTGTLTFGGLSTSSPGITSGQPLYATGVNTIASVASSTFLTSIGGQTAGNYITALTGDGTASGPGSAALTLATVNSNVGTFTYPSVTVNGKGLITAISSGSAPTTYSATYPVTLTGSAFGLAFGTTTANSWSALQQFNGNASTTALTISGNEWLTALGTAAGTFLAVDANGKIIATSSPSAGGITAIGPTGQTQTGPTVTIATTTSSFNGLTVGNTVVGSTNTLTWTPSLSGVLTEAGGGTSESTYSKGDMLYASAANTLDKLGIGTGGYVLASANGVPTWVATSSITGAVSSVSNSDGTLTISPTTGAVVASLALGHTNTWTGAQIFNAGASSTQFTTGGNTWLATTSGSVRVGPDAGDGFPSSVFSVSSASTDTGSGVYNPTYLVPNISLRNTNTTANNYEQFLLINGGGGFTGAITGINESNTLVGAVGSIDFAVNNSGSYSHVRIDHSGDVGIGTSSPSQKLSVTGNALISGIATGIVSSINGLLQDLTISSGFSLSSNTLSQVEHRSFTYATSTAWTGTTTIPIESGYGEVFNSVRCFTDAGTLGVDFYHSTSHLNYIPTASTTNNVNTFSANNTITSGDKTYVDIGTPASSPTKINCTVADTY